jgi:hypothetical protein
VVFLSIYIKGIMKDEILTLKDVTDALGINYIAAWHMTEFNVLNETEIIEDLRNGMIFGWLTFIDRYTDSNTNNFEDSIMRMFMDEINDNMIIDLPPIELQRMIDDENYAGSITFKNLDERDRVVSTFLIRLKLKQYLDLLKFGL